MLNPKLKEIYDANVIVVLQPLADYFEQRNEQAYIVGLLGEELGMRVPDSILYDNEEIKDEVSLLTSKCYHEYAGHLSSKDDEKIGNFFNCYKHKFWGGIYEEEELIPLWVK